MTDYTPEMIREGAARANSTLIGYFQQEIPRLLGQHHAFDPAGLKQVFALNTDAERYINGGLFDGGFINRIGGLYTPEERSFILDVSSRFERVKLGFAYFGLMRSTRRPLEAIRLANYQYRAGWQKTGVPLSFNQDVGEHQQSVRRLAFLLYFDHPKIELVESVCGLHDTGEAVIGDFTPKCDISKTDKARIEDLGVRLITLHTRRMDDHPIAHLIHEAIEIYEERVPEHADVQVMVKDCDLIDMGMEAIFLMGNAPHDERPALHDKLQEFWDYIGPRLQTERGQRFFTALATHRHDMDLNETTLKKIWIEAHRAMMMQEPDPMAAYDRFQNIAEMRETERLRHEDERAAALNQPRIVIAR